MFDREELTEQLREAGSELAIAAADEIERLREFARAADARFVEHGMISMTERLAYLAAHDSEEPKA